MATEPTQSGRPLATTSEPLIGRAWVQGVALVMIFGFLILGVLVYRTYTASMPLPDKVLSQSGRLLFTKEDITRGGRATRPQLQLHQNPASLQLRYLQTLLELGADQNSTVVFPLPVDIITPFLKNAAALEDIAVSQNDRR